MVPGEPPPPPEDPTSVPWIRNIVAGRGRDPDWQSLYERYRTALHVYAARQLGPALLEAHDPEDLVQNAWAEVCSQIRDFEYRGKGSLRAWLRLKIRRRVLNLARRPSADAGDPAAIEQAPADDSVAGAVAGRELHQHLLRTLDSLPATYRRVVEARYIEGHRVVSIARAHGLKPDTVSQQLRRGLALWKQALGEDPSTHLGWAN